MNAFYKSKTEEEVKEMQIRRITKTQTETEIKKQRNQAKMSRCKKFTLNICLAETITCLCEGQDQALDGKH